MSVLGGTKAVRYSAGLVMSLLLAGGLISCAYEGEGDPQPAAERSARPAPALPSASPEILSVQSGNYAELEKRLAAAPGSVLLDQSGPADGPGVGFSKAVTVKTAGSYTVTAACVGIPEAQILVGRPGSSDFLSLDLDCSGVKSQVVELQAGPVHAQLMRQDPNGPWTGAVAGLRITIG
ncbi:hypothetical protein [Arthrobacter oryzae]|jgi:hypothetical protein|uniref:hypothetical protein n=1 Tax=Arthrobacter oryzae TaxID=409290 RepID=UPI0027881993|nr:hypothetical protein [Arthrobacter oryzae]MDQ0075768.1 hypothetical protein [Arthrobacter oryzae]